MGTKYVIDPDGELGALFLRRVPKDLREKFKLTCMANHTDMQAEIVRFMEEYSSEYVLVKKT